MPCSVERHAISYVSLKWLVPVRNNHPNPDNKKHVWISANYWIHLVKFQTNATSHSHTICSLVETWHNRNTLSSFTKMGRPLCSPCMAENRSRLDSRPGTFDVKFSMNSSNPWNNYKFNFRELPHWLPTVCFVCLRMAHQIKNRLWNCWKVIPTSTEMVGSMIWGVENQLIKKSITKKTVKCFQGSIHLLAPAPHRHP